MAGAGRSLHSVPFQGVTGYVTLGGEEEKSQRVPNPRGHAPGEENHRGEKPPGQSFHPAPPAASRGVFSSARGGSVERPRSSWKKINQFVAAGAGEEFVPSVRICFPR